MAASITEVFKSQESDVGIEQSTRTLYYTVIGSEVSDVVEALIQATIPAFYKSLQLQSYRFNHQGGGTWEVEARYASKQPKEVGKKSLDRAIFSKDPLKSVDFKGAINVQPDNKVEGVDVGIPKFDFTVQRIIADPLPTLYAVALEALTYRVNTDTVVLNISGVIYTFLPGELLFKGATGSKRGTADWEINLQCSCSRNADNLQFATAVDDEFITVDKLGWWYLWVRYEEAVSKSTLLPVPKQVHTEQVYYTAPLSVLFA